MKKIIAAIAFFILVTAAATADVMVGIRGSAGWGLGSSTSMSGYETDVSKSWMFGGFLYGKIPVSVVENLYIQPEVGIVHGTVGIKDKSDKDLKTETSYNAFVIPVLLAYDFPVTQSFIVSIEGGPEVSFLMGKINGKATYDGDKLYDMDVNPDSRVLFSGVVGMGMAYAFSSGTYFVSDLRYDLGFNEIKGEDAKDGVTPRGLNLSAGFQLRF